MLVRYAIKTPVSIVIGGEGETHKDIKFTMAVNKFFEVYDISECQLGFMTDANKFVDIYEGMAEAEICGQELPSIDVFF